jgi:hypothetical protein
VEGLAGDAKGEVTLASAALQVDLVRRDHATAEAQQLPPNLPGDGALSFTVGLLVSGCWWGGVVSHPRARARLRTHDVGPQGFSVRLGPVSHRAVRHESSPPSTGHRQPDGESEEFWGLAYPAGSTGRPEEKQFDRLIPLALNLRLFFGVGRKVLSVPVSRRPCHEITFPVPGARGC